VIFLPRFGTPPNGASRCAAVKSKAGNTALNVDAVFSKAEPVCQVLIRMPIAYERDDQRRLITVTIIEPHSVGEILGVIDRQAAEETWGYAMLYDLRALTHTFIEADLQQMADRVKVVGGRRERGPMGMAVGPRPEHFRMGLMYARLTKSFVTVEVLLTEAQRDEWLARNARGSSRQP
jgi:hypothetical protein